MTVFDDEYRALIETARDAVDELLQASEHDSWLRLRIAYGYLREAIEQDDAERGREARPEVVRPGESAWREHKDEWRAIGWEVRERLLLEVLGNGRRTASELADAMNERLGWSEGWVINPETARALAMRMVARGELERAADGCHRGHTGVWRWYRRRGLEGPIAELEQAFGTDEAEVA